MRRVTTIVLAGAAAIAAALPSAAQNFPSRPVTILVNSEAGGPPDFLSRLVKDGMAAHLGQTVIVDYRVGAGGVTGTAAVTRADPDGYTILATGYGPIVTSPLLFPTTVPYDPVKDLVPINRSIVPPTVFATRVDVPASNLKDFVELAKKNPGKYSFASPGAGTPAHLGPELLKAIAGIDIVHVPYRGTPSSVLGVISGDAELICHTVGILTPHVESGKLKFLAADQRLASRPDVPTLAELRLDGAVAGGWFSFWAPKGTPRAIVDRLNAAIDHALKDEKVREIAAKAGYVVVSDGPDALGALHKSELARWSKFIKETNFKIER